MKDPDRFKQHHDLFVSHLVSTNSESDQLQQTRRSEYTQHERSEGDSLQYPRVGTNEQTWTSPTCNAFHAVGIADTSPARTIAEGNPLHDIELDVETDPRRTDDVISSRVQLHHDMTLVGEVQHHITHLPLKKFDTLIRRLRRRRQFNEN